MSFTTSKGAYMWANLPNYITLLRIILIPFFIALMIYEYYREAFLVFIVAGVTDALDGMIARFTNTQTELGAFLDPMADKLLIVSAFLTLVLLDKLPVWLVLIVVSRDVILALGSMVLFLLGYSLKVRPSILGKATTVMQLMVVALTLVVISYGVETRLMVFIQSVTAALTIASGVHYVFKGLKMVG